MTITDSKKGLRNLINLFSNHDKNGGNTHPNATRTQSGFMSPKDKLKVDTLLTPQFMPNGTDLSTLPSGYYNITDAIGKPPEAYAGSQCYYEIFRSDLTRFIEGEQIIIRAYQRSTGMSWDKMFYSNSEGVTDKGWSFIVKRERLLTSEEITQLNQGEVISLADKLSSFTQIHTFSISHSYVSELKTMDYKASGQIYLRDMNITDVDNELFFVELQLLYDQTNKTIKIGNKSGLKWNKTTKDFDVVDSPIVVKDIYVSWFR